MARITVEDKIAKLKLTLAADKLTEIKTFGSWEEGFLTSVFEQYEIRGVNSLSEKQLKKIHDIYDNI